MGLHGNAMEGFQRVPPWRCNETRFPVASNSVMSAWLDMMDIGTSLVETSVWFPHGLLPINYELPYQFTHELHGSVDLKGLLPDKDILVETLNAKRWPSQEALRRHSGAIWKVTPLNGSFPTLVSSNNSNSPDRPSRILWEPNIEEATLPANINRYSINMWVQNGWHRLCYTHVYTNYPHMDFLIWMLLIISYYEFGLQHQALHRHVCIIIHIAHSRSWWIQ